MARKPQNGKPRPGKKDMRRDNRNRAKRDVEEKEIGSRTPIRSSDNDVSWYAQNEFLLRDASSIPFNTPAGGQINLNDSNSTGLTQIVTSDFAIPGVLGIRYVPMIGISAGGYSPINIASRNIYSYVRHANSGHSNYDAPDLMIYLLAMDQLYSMYSFMCRAYGVMQLYNVRNRYMPRALIKAMHLNFEDLMAHLADFRYYINVCAEKIGSLCVPSSMPYFWRHIWMNQNVYADSGRSQKSQFYLYVPQGFYIYDPVTDPTGGKLRFFDLGEGGVDLTFEAIRSTMDSMIAAVITDEDMNIMSGDILKAYGPDGVMKVGRIPEDYAVVPTYNEEVLGQIMNSYAVGKPSISGDERPYYSNMIYQDTEGNILQNYVVDPITIAAGRGSEKTNFAGVCFAKIINSYTDAVTPAEVMVSSRLMPTGACNYIDNKWYTTLTSCGSEVVSQFEMFGFNWVGPEVWDIADPLVFGSAISTAVGNNGLAYYTSVIWKILHALDSFAFHPTIYVYEPTNGGITVVPSEWRLSDVVLNADNYTVIHSTTLSKMHETALLSEFSVPQMGSFSVKTTG